MPAEAPTSSLSGRLLAGISGQAATRVANAVSTLALVPLLIKAWGVEGFGEWMALTALASYLTYANFGLLTTAGNDMVMAVGRDDQASARHTFRAAINFIAFVLLPLFGFVALGFFQIPFDRILHLKVIPERDAVIVASLSLLQLWTGTLRGMIAASLNASGRYGLIYCIDGAAKIGELASVAIVLLLFGGGFVAAASALVIVALLDLLVVVALARRFSPWATPDFAPVDLAWLRTQIRPGVGFALGSFATQGILLQGPRVVLGAVLGGNAVAVFSVFATATRLIDQAVFVFVFPLDMEVSRSVGRGELRRAYRLVIAGTQGSWLALALAGCSLIVLGPAIFHVWTAGRIEFDFGLMALFLLMSACIQLGRVSTYALMGTNRMYGPGALMLPATVLCLVLGGALAYRLGVSGMVLGVTAGEFAVAAIAIGALTRWLGRGPVGFLRDLLDVRAAVEHVPRLADRLLRRVAPRHRRGEP